ncbi:MAG: UDP-glucose/GDP-mannose dehydrogenase family protein [Planctomycetota bacterium]
MRIAVIGTGYVGLVTGACFAETGNHVACVDKDEKKIQTLIEGGIPIYEPGLGAIVTNNYKAGRLEFTTDLEDAVRRSQILFIAVGTPSGEDGSADLSAVETVAAQIGRAMNDRKIIVDKSTVPVGTAQRVSDIIAKETEHSFAVVSNPEFLKEGAAVEDFMRPDRVVIGCDDADAVEVMRALYAPYMRRGDRLLVMDPASAEMTKYAANSMLATRISFMNEVAALCEKVGANVEHVRRGLGSDTRIGAHFLFPGVGFGGSCFPKDLRALVHTGSENGMRMRVLDAVTEVNAHQKTLLVRKAKERFGDDLSGKVFALWGLAFKPGTDDMREAPAIEIVNGLLEAGAEVRGHDPVATEIASEIFEGRIALSDDPYAMLDGADALMLVTEWLSFRSPDFADIKSRLRTPVVFDGRNAWNPKMARDAGLSYHGVGL